ncbi:SMI1/KNR4 family protein [Roseibium sediminis]|uniref:SMI1/KNR4 family protein n=1 Tax=Roseibium sediminis TaxID=1775174 RepID=UPI00123C976C|nr:SMI1/KNR4 family protein [Roseibium sediminis]
MVKILQAEPGLTPAEMVGLEGWLGFALPEPLKAQLLKKNGGRPVPECFKFLDYDGPYSDSLIDWFLTFDADAEHSNFFEYFDMYHRGGRILPHMIPFAHDPFGNLLLISVSGKDEGAVFFWDHEREDGNGPSYDNLNFLGTDLQHFYSRLFAWQG